MRHYFCFIFLCVCTVCMMLPACTPSREEAEVIPGPVVQKDGRLYFTSLPFEPENSGDKRAVLYRMKPNGKDLEALTKIDWPTSILVFAGDYLYCLEGQYDVTENLLYPRFKQIYQITDINNSDKTKRKIKLNLDIQRGYIVDIAQSGKAKLFYTDSQKPGFFRARADGSQSTRISDMEVGKFWIHGDWVYFHHGYYSQTPERGFYRMRLDGTYVEKLSNDFPAMVRFMDDWLYFTDANGDTLYRMKTNGKERRKLFDENAAFQYLVFEVTPERLYFRDLHTLYALNPDGDGQVTLLADMVCSFKVHGEWIYYVNILDHALHKIRPDGTGDMKLNDEKISSVPMEFFIMGDWIYYYRDADSRLCRMKLDGSRAGPIVS